MSELSDKSNRRFLQARRVLSIDEPAPISGRRWSVFPALRVWMTPSPDRVSGLRPDSIGAMFLCGSAWPRNFFDCLAQDLNRLVPVHNREIKRETEACFFLL